METQVLPISDPKALAKAIDILTAGGLVAFPTDTVYGLGALAFDENAVAQLYDVKERGMDKAIPVLIGDINQLERVAAGKNAMCDKLARLFWPGALTLVVPRHSSIPDAVTPLPTVGVRIPKFTATQDLL